MDDSPVMIASGDIAVDVEPTQGGRIGQITVSGTPLLVAHSDVFAGPLTWGAYPMVPWAGRIRNGTFEFRGRRYELPRNHGNHAMHGVGYVSEWEVAEHDATSIRLTLQLPSDARWPFGGRVEQRFQVADDGVRLTMRVDADDHAFPASFGWHPWFRKPDRLDFRPVAMYRRDDDHIALDELVAVPPGPWDDCFVNDQPIGITVDGVDLRFSSTSSCWVVYDEPEHATCVEPQTGPPDAATIAPLVIEAGGSAALTARLDVIV
ncbi:MAG: aldose epimerase [Ilumatobacteraceae bacterium]